MPDELVTIATYRFAPKAEMARVLLEQEGIAAFVADATPVSTDWLLSGTVGNVKLQVPESQTAAANALLEKHPHVLDHGPLAEETTVDETTRCLACGAKMSDSDVKCPACGWSYEAKAAADE